MKRPGHCTYANGKCEGEGNPRCQWCRFSINHEMRSTNVKKESGNAKK